MDIWSLIQLFFNIIIGLSIGVLWLRLQRPAKDDPRLSQGLQLLQGKISVLEDLSDRTENQAKQLTHLLEKKSQELQAKIQMAEGQIGRISQSMEKSMEVAQIFQDKIPHQEIIHRQTTMRYVRAAQLAHQGASVDQICQQVDLPRSEVEFICKVNRDQLVFSPDQLPAWAHTTTTPTTAMAGESGAVAAPIPTAAALKQVSEQFRTQGVLTNTNISIESAISESLAKIRAQSEAGVANFLTAPEAAPKATQTNPVGQSGSTLAQRLAAARAAAANRTIASEKVADNPQIRPVEFPRIDMPT